MTTPQWYQNFVYQIRKLLWPFFSMGAGFLYIRLLGSELLKQQVGVLAWKAVLVGIATVFAHFVRIQLFPYIDLSEAIREKSVSSSLLVLSMVILTATIIFAICSGL